MKKVFLGAFLFFFFSLYGADTLYLTFTNDPSHEIAVHWLEEGNAEKEKQVFYKKAAEKEWKAVLPDQVAWGKDLLKKAILVDLEAHTDYVFQIQEEPQLYFFHTLPSNLDEGLKVAIGGDAYQRRKTSFEEMNKQVARTSPHFVILGGDIAYANQGDPYKRWKEFLRMWHSSMKTPDGKIIPLVAAVGNHEVLSKAKGGGELFLKLFPYLENGSYGALDLGDRAFFLLLDTGHISPIEGAQVEWTAKVLKEKQEYPYRFAVYHIGAYPSIYKYTDKTAALIRTSWCPLFEEYKVTACFENHNHAFKRTFPIRQEKIDPSGVVYIGDGAWAVPPRTRRDKRWYLETRKSSNCVSLLTLTSKEAKVETIDIQGRVIDEWRAGRGHPGQKED